MADGMAQTVDSEIDEEEAHLRAHGSQFGSANTLLSSPGRLRGLVAAQDAHAVIQKFYEGGKEKTLIRAPKSTWVERMIHLDGKPFRFGGRKYLPQIYNTNYPRKLLLFSRQSEKSSMLANELIINSIVTAYFKALYVSPSYLQSRQFSNGKLKPWIEDSPVINKYFVNSATSNQVFERGYTNGSLNFIRSAFLNADRVRGISADLLCLDEGQDLLTSVLSVIRECLSHSPNPRELMSGTPKTFDNPMEVAWQQSSMCEWLIPCDRHSPRYWNYIDEKIIGLLGPICNKCGKPINPADGQWVSFSNTWDIAGFRVSQPMVPWMYEHPDKWSELVFKKKTYSLGQFRNECLAISHDSATKPVSRRDLVACCSTLYPFRHHPDRLTNQWQIFAGVDWGEGTDGADRSEKGKLKNASYTILTLGTYIMPGKFHYFYYRRFEGTDVAPSVCVPEIIETCRRFRITCMGVDYGFGWGVNERLEEAFGLQKVIRYQYVGMQKERKKFDPIGVKYQLNRTEVMSDFFNDIKKGVFLWPEWESVKNYLKDVEHVFAEYSESARALKYDHRQTDPDDACHASILCREAADNYFGVAR